MRFEARRGVARHDLFNVLGNLSQKDAQEIDATIGPGWSADALSRLWTQRQIDGLTMLADGQVAAVALAWTNGHGHWTCGMVTSERWPAIALAASRYLGRYLAMVLLGQRVRRASCVVDAGHTHAQRWLSFLGFQCEGRLAEYGQDGRDFMMFAMLPKSKIKTENNDV